ncbi:MAG: helix-hairpin-helix domain-containing protein [Leucobacter sp.]
MGDRGAVFDGVKIGRPATGALLDAGFAAVGELPQDPTELLQLHGVGPSAVKRLQEAREQQGSDR